MNLQEKFEVAVAEAIVKKNKDFVLDQEENWLSGTDGELFMVDGIWYDVDVDGMAYTTFGYCAGDRYTPESSWVDSVDICLDSITIYTEENELIDIQLNPRKIEKLIKNNIL